MAKAAKKLAAKPAAKAAAKPAAKAKPEKKAAAPKKEAPPKKEIAPKKEAKKEAPVSESEEDMPAEIAVAPVAKVSKREKAAKAAADKIISEDLKKWSDFKEKFGAEKASPYNMSATFEAHQPLQHKVLGWGYILSVQNDRLEVLFESGPKVLISNYKSA